MVNGKTRHEGLVEAVREVARAHAVEVDARVSERAGDARRLAAEAARSGYATIAAVGGDGTLNEVACGVLDVEGFEGSVGVVPAGTANDFATAAGLADDDPRAAAELLVLGSPIPIDVGRANGRAFVNVATAGFASEVSARASGWIKALLGRMAYLVSTIGHLDELEPVGVTVSGPDLKWEGEFLLLAIGNGRAAGGGVRVCPDALVDDGALDVTILPSPIEPDVLSGLLEEGLAGLERHLVRRRTRSLMLESGDPLQLNLDGEPIEARAYRIEVDERALRFHLPPDSPLLTLSGG